MVFTTAISCCVCIKAGANICLRFFTKTSASGLSALFTTNTSAISIKPAFMVCTSSPASGTTTTTVVSAKPAISISLCPTPTVSTIIKSKAAVFKTSVSSIIFGCKPPKLPRVANERMNTLGLLYHSLILILSPNKAPKLNGEEGSTHNTPTVFC